MPYTRPTAPLELDPAVTLLSSPMVWALGSTGSKTSFGRAAQLMTYVGDAGLLSEDTDSWNILYSTSANYFALDSSQNSLDSNTFTRLFVVDVPSDMASGNPMFIWEASRENSGGYVSGALKLYITTDLKVKVDRANQAALGEVAGQLVLGAKNRIALTRYADNTGALSVNGGAAVTLPASANKFAFGEMLGNAQFRAEWQQGLNLDFYAHSASSVTGAVLAQLSDNPARITRTVGGSAPADTTPPTLISLGSTADGTSFLLTANESLKNQVVPTSSITLSGGHTVSSISIVNGVAVVAITPALTQGEASLTASYSASSAGFVDAAGNQLASFSNLIVANNVGTAFWKFLGNEGATVTVAPNTKVRYGITGKYVEKILSGTFIVGTAAFDGTDPAFGSIKHVDAYVTDLATGYTLSGPAIGPVGESSPFTVDINGLTAGDLILTPTGAGLTFSPPEITLNNNKMTATFSVFAATPGDYTFTIANNKGFSNPAAKAYKALTSIFRTFGTGGDSATLDAAIAAVGQTDPAGARIMVVLEGLSDVASVNSQIEPTSANESFYYLIRPKKELQFGELNKAGSLHESMTGATINIAANSLRMGGGVVIEGYKINITSAEGLKWTSGGAGPEARLRRCFVIANADRAMINQAYKPAAMEDTFVIRTTTNTGRMFHAPWVLKLDRCTWYNKGGGVGKAHDGGWGNGAYIKNSAYVGFGADPIDQIGGFTRLNNVSTSAMADQGGFIVDTVNAAFISSTNYRAGPALVGKAGVDAKSINDVLGNNRGTSPDVGAAQAVAATPLAVGTATSQPDPDASRVSGFFSYTGTVNSATVSLNALTDGQSIGPLPVTVSAGTGSFQIDDVVPGSYAAPDVQLINAGGSLKVTGFTPFDVNGIGGGPVDPGTQVDATALVWSPPGAGLVGVESTIYSVGLNGTYTGTVRVTPSDSGGSGSFNPTFLDLVNGATGSFTYTPVSTGTKSISLANNKSLANPNPANYVVTAPTVIVPKVALELTVDGTIPVADMTGLQYAWFDQTLPQNFTAPKLKGNNGAITGGVFNLILTGSALVAGGVGTLVLTNGNGDPAQNPAALVFAGPVKVQ